MSENKENNVEKCANRSKEDDDLAELLDSSLQEFGKSKINPLLEEDNQGDSDPCTSDFDPASAYKAASDFQSMLLQLAEIQKIALENMGTVSGDSTNGHDMPNGNHNTSEPDSSTDGQQVQGGQGQSDQEEVQFVQSFIQNMQFLAEKAQKVQHAKSEEEFVDAMKELGNDESYEQEFMPFMQGLMSSLLSKDMLYGSLKEMCDKYPTWLEENRQKLDEPTLERYESQLKLMQQACQEYDNESSNETDEQRAQRFERLIVIMQKMQACGHPPEELVGSLPPGWSLDKATGLPHVDDAEKAAEACSLM